MLTVVMYHYVRDPALTRFPGIKACAVDRFRRQLDHLAAHHTVVSPQDCLRAFTDRAPLPADAALLTFDDGLADHWTTVVPLLAARGWRGCFFPSALPLERPVVLDVHRIQHLLATIEPTALLAAVRGAIGDGRYAGLWAAHATASRFDPAEIVFLKRVLQFALPEAERTALVDRLFRDLLGIAEPVLHQELYLTPGQLRAMAGMGHLIGFHGYAHRWLATLDDAELDRELDLGQRAVAGLGADPAAWAACYPSGSYDQRVLDGLRRRRCRLGFTTRVAVADPATDDALLIPRLDCNDLPA